MVPRIYAQQNRVRIFEAAGSETMSNETSVTSNSFVDDVVQSTASTINSVINKEEEVVIQSITSSTTNTITSTEMLNCAVEHCRPLHVVDERVTTLMNSDTTTSTLSPSDAEELPLLDFTDLLKEADEQLQQLIGAIAFQEGEEVVQDPAKTRNSTRTENDDCNDANTDKGAHDADESTFIIGVSSSTSTPLMSNIPCIGSTSNDDDDSDAIAPDLETTLLTLVSSSESKPKDKQDSNPNNHSRSEVLQRRQGEEEDECTTASASPEKSFLWYYPKSLFITSAAVATASTMTKPHELLDSKDFNHKKWWWNTTNGVTNTSNIDDSSTLRAYPQDASIPVDRTSSSLLLRKQLQTALDQQQQQLLLQQPSNPMTSHHDNPSKLLAVRNQTTGCTAIQLGEETFRITISIPDITISQVIHYISNPNTLSSWFHAVITSTTHTANPVSSTRHHLLTSTTGTKKNVQTEPSLLPVTAESNDPTIGAAAATTTTRSKQQQEEALSLSSSILEGQQRFDAEWFESTVTLRIPTFWCSCYNLWIQLVKLSPYTINNESSSQLTLFVDHRRSRISITYLLGGCEVNHTFTFTSSTTTATPAPAICSSTHNQQHQRRMLVHIKDTLRVIPLGSSSTNNCYRCIRPLLRKYVLPNIQSHMKQTMISLENLQAVFTKGAQGHRSGDITTTTKSTVSTGDDLTTPLLSSI